MERSEAVLLFISYLFMYIAVEHFYKSYCFFRKNHYLCNYQLKAKIDYFTIITNKTTV